MRADRQGDLRLTPGTELFHVLPMVYRFDSIPEEPLSEEILSDSDA